MSRILQQLIGSQGRLVEQMLAGLERATGRPGYDVDLIGQIFTATNHKLRQLGFQPNLVAAIEVRSALSQCFTKLEQDFELRFATDQELIEFVNQAIQGVKVIELSPVARDRLDVKHGDYFDQIANMQRGYFQTSQLKVVSESINFDERLVPEIVWRQDTARLRGFLLTALDIAERVRQSNQLALILVAKNRSIKLKAWLEQSYVSGWTLAGFSLVSGVIEEILADASSKLHCQIRHDRPELVDGLSNFRLEKLVSEVTNDSFFFDTYGLGLVNEQIISFNIFDQFLQDNRQLYATVYRQMIGKYLQNPDLIKQITNQLDKKLLN